jgi:hypothetical protein
MNDNRLVLYKLIEWPYGESEIGNYGGAEITKYIIEYKKYALRVYRHNTTYYVIYEGCFVIILEDFEAVEREQYS